jgi:proteasome lid subunit RPN8/RPN11
MFDKRNSSDQTSTLRFSPTAWAKLVFLRDYGPTEVGGFGIAAADDLLYVEDVALVRQSCTGMSVAFDDDSVADFFDRQVDQGRKIEQFARIWVHTHPGNCPRPSGTDEATFSRVFGRNAWAVMFILAQDGQNYGRLRFGVGPGGSVTLATAVDYSRPFGGSDYGVWEDEYLANVEAAEPTFLKTHPDTLTCRNALTDDLSLVNPESWSFFDHDDLGEFHEIQEAVHGH